MQVSLIERRKSGIELTEQGEEIVRRGRTTLPQCAMCSITPSIASVCCRERSSSGPFRQSPPYLLSAALPELQRCSPNLTLHLSETITETLVRELVSGDLDLILVALPIEGHEIETQSLFGDKFVLAACASKGKRAKAADMLAHERLLLLEEGHCLRSGVVLLPTGDAGGARELRCVEPRHHRAERRPWLRHHTPARNSAE